MHLQVEMKKESAGIYIHVPFCRKACTYCNFHFSTSQALVEDVVACIIHELHERKSYLEGAPIQSVYFGGGTPSILNGDQLSAILSAVHDDYTIIKNAEITLEANPDDLTKEKLHNLSDLGINRLSIGIQSFDDRDLVWMNRSHSAQQAIQCIDEALSAGFQNLSLDLIYSIPGQSQETWIKNLRRVVDLQIPHLSCYTLTVEPGTALFSFVKSGKVIPVADPVTERNYFEMIDMLEAGGYENYEISNFAKNKNYAVHNSSYWTGAWYLGVGPSAHSFNTASRRWNISNNSNYIRLMRNQQPYFEEEYLTPDQQCNEFIMTSLRTQWGIDLHQFELQFGKKRLEELWSDAEYYLQSGQLIAVGGKMVVSRQGKLLTDRIISDLFRV